MSFFIKDDEVWEKYDEIWDVIKNKLSIKFHSLPVYDKSYLKSIIIIIIIIIFTFIRNRKRFF